ncbi:glycosyl transferase family 2, partial [Enterococcus hirae]
VPLKLVERDVNGGQMAAMSDGLALVDGADFVVFVDSDDVLFEDFIHAHVDAHLNRRYPAALSCSNEVIIDDRDSVIARTIEKWE